nr:hypothetical protein [Angustibacter aerolatus]
MTRPGGTIAVLAWTPTGFIGRLFATMRSYVPAPPAGVQPPPLWGDEDHVREPARRPRRRRPRRPPLAGGRPVRLGCGVPRLLQGALRPDRRRLPGRRRRPRPHRRPRPRPRGPRRRRRRRRRDGLGVPAGHRPPPLTRGPARHVKSAPAPFDGRARLSDGAPATGSLARVSAVRAWREGTQLSTSTACPSSSTT